MREKIVIVDAGRTAVGTFGGSLSSLPAPEMGATVIKALLERTGIKPEQVDEVILGQVLTAGSGQSPARQTTLKAGLPVAVPALTINKVCGSGLKAVHLAMQAVACGDAEIVIAGGQESMTRSGHVLPGSRDGVRMGDWKMQDTMIVDGLQCAFNGYHMGVTAENIAKKYGFSRQAQDEFAAASQQKAEAAQKAGRFDAEIVQVSIPQRKGDPLVFAADEFPRHGTTAESLAKLRPAFDKEGTVTAGNASGINDGAAFFVLAAADVAAKAGHQPMARLVSYAVAGVPNDVMGEGPIPATRKALAKAGLSLDQMDVIESNEAFAAQALSVAKVLGLDQAKTNPNGGAIALGHPVGCSGAFIATKALYELQRIGGKYCLVTMCIGGGQGIAAIFERA